MRAMRVKSHLQVKQYNFVESLNNKETSLTAFHKTIIKKIRMKKIK